jgi:aerobic-type carbon monoxide dehydrogenase small subunit (CoxS/CutS family)
MAEEPDTLARSQMFDTSLMLNGTPWNGSVPAETVLLDLLRERCGLTGTKRSCESEVCGACTVLVDGRAVSSCTYLAAEAAGRSVLTIEGLEQEGRLDPLQEAFLRHEGFQCGFCTSGMIMCSKALLLENPAPSRQEIADYLRGNICRCGAYVEIVGAVLEAAALQSVKGEGEKA